MPRLAPEQRLEDRVGPSLVCERRVGRVRLAKRDERQGVKDARFAVPWMLALHLLHRLRVRDQSRLGIDGCVGLVVGTHRRKVGPLAGRSRNGVAAHSRTQPGPELVRGRRRPQRMKQAHRLAPVAHGARRVSGDHVLERLARALIPEGMQQRDAALEAALCFGTARRRERDAPERLSVSPVFVDRLCREPGGGECQSRERGQRDAGGHGAILQGEGSSIPVKMLSGFRTSTARRNRD